MSLRPLHIAALGWEHPGWAESFYPDDIPPEWRLDYYANEFRAVALPSARWGECSPEALAEWAEEAHETFHFFLMAGAEDRPGALQAAAGALGERFGGCLIDAPSEAVPAALLQAAAGAGPLGLLLVQPSPQAPAAGAACGPVDGGVQCRGEGLVAARWSPAQGRDPRALRALIESLVQVPGEGEALLLFDGEPPDVEAMRAATVIAELLGV